MTTDQPTIDMPDMPDGATCPACSGAGVVLGTLGDLIHLTCRDCGLGFHIEEVAV